MSIFIFVTTKYVNYIKLWPFCGLFYIYNEMYEKPRWRLLTITRILGLIIYWFIDRSYIHSKARFNLILVLITNLYFELMKKSISFWSKSISYSYFFLLLVKRESTNSNLKCGLWKFCITKYSFVVKD